MSNLSKIREDFQEIPYIEREVFQGMVGWFKVRGQRFNSVSDMLYGKTRRLMVTTKPDGSGSADVWIKNISKFFGRDIFEQFTDEMLARFTASFYARVSFAIQQERKMEKWIQEVLILRMLCNELFGTNDGIPQDVARAPELLKEKAYEDGHFAAHLAKFNAQTAHYVSCLQDPDYVPPVTEGWTPEMKKFIIDTLRESYGIEMCESKKKIETPTVVETVPEPTHVVVSENKTGNRSFRDALVKPVESVEVCWDTTPATSDWNDDEEPTPQEPAPQEPAQQNSNPIQVVLEFETREELINVVNMTGEQAFHVTNEITKILKELENNGITEKQANQVNKITELVRHLGMFQERAALYGCPLTLLIPNIRGKSSVTQKVNDNTVPTTPIPESYNTPSVF